MPQFQQSGLIWQCWTWANERHIPPQNVKNLRQFIQTGFPQEFPQRCNILVGMFKLVGRNIVRCIHFHGAKFMHAECGRVAVGISFSGTLLYEKNRSSVEKKHRNDDNQHHGTGWYTSKNAKDDIQQPLSITAVKSVQRKPLLSLFCSE